jgi:hypothetical protein
MTAKTEHPVDVEAFRDYIAKDLWPQVHPIDSVVEWENNYHDGNVPDVKRSYEQFGQRKPIVVRRLPEGGGRVSAGNTQLRAARDLGWDVMAMVWVDEEEDDAIAYAIADNHTAETGTTDDDLLLMALDAIKFNPLLVQATAYTDDDIRMLMASTGRSAEAEAAFLAGLTDNSGTGEPHGVLAVGEGAQLIFTFASREDRERVTEVLRAYMIRSQAPTLASALLHMCEAMATVDG